MAALHVLDGEIIGGVPLGEEFEGRYGTAVDLTPYNNSGNQYIIPSDGHIYVTNMTGLPNIKFLPFV